MSSTGGSPVGAVRVAARPASTAGERLLDAARDAASDVRVVHAGPTGADAVEPLVLCTRDGRTALHSSPSPDDVAALVASLEAGDLPTADAAAVVAHDPDVGTLPVPDDHPLSAGVRRVLDRCGWVDPVDPAGHEFLDDPDPETVGDLGLLGRGRGDAATDDPVFDEWTTARGADGDAVVVVNANEADERSLGDATLLAGDPLPVLDAAAAVAGFVDATDVVVYCNEADAARNERVREAADAASDRLDVAFQVVTGPDEFTAGEETMALEAMAGADRIEARIRPPGPAEHGLHGRPTVVHTPRTLAQVWRALAHPGEFDADDADPGTRVVTVTADDRTATVELPTGSALADASDAVDADSFKAAVVGGRFGGLARDLDVAASAPSLRGAGLGTNGAVELLDESACVVAEVGERARFASERNCGRCVPCREGSTQLLEKLRAVYDGSYDADGIRELARVMRRSSTCAFGVAAARPVATALDEFEPSFRAHAAGRCPSGTCENL